MALITDSIITDLAIALVTALVFIYRWLASINNTWRERGIPYVKPVLFFGNYKDLILGKRPIFYIQVEIYNKLEGEKFGGYHEIISPCLMVRDPELIEKVLVKDFAHFVDRGESLVDIEREPLSAGLSLLTGNQWRHMRYKLTPTFTSGKLKGMFEQIYNCGEELLKELKKAAVTGEAIESKTVMTMFSSDVIASCAFGLQFEHDSEEGKVFRTMAETLFTISKMQMLKFFLANYNKRLAKFFGPLSFPKETKLTDEVLAAQVFLFLTAGSETVSWVTSFTLHSLSNNPVIQEKAQREVDDVLAKHGGWSYQAIKDMTYLDQIVQESLRFNPFVVSLPRVVTSPYKIPGTDIVLEKGVRINIPVYPLNMDPRVYPDPHTFKPERFKDNNHKQSWKYLTFGDGPRMCIGMRFALLEVKMCLARILSRFTVRPSDKTPRSLKYEASFFPMPKGGIWLHFQERSLRTGS